MNGLSTIKKKGYNKICLAECCNQIKSYEYFSGNISSEKYKYQTENALFRRCVIGKPCLF